MVKSALKSLEFLEFSGFFTHFQDPPGQEIPRGSATLLKKKSEGFRSQMWPRMGEMWRGGAKIRVEYWVKIIHFRVP